VELSYVAINGPLVSLDLALHMLVVFVNCCLGFGLSFGCSYICFSLFVLVAAE